MRSCLLSCRRRRLSGRSGLPLLRGAASWPGDPKQRSPPLVPRQRPCDAPCPSLPVGGPRRDTSLHRADRNALQGDKSTRAHVAQSHQRHVETEGWGGPHRDSPHSELLRSLAVVRRHPLRTKKQSPDGDHALSAWGPSIDAEGMRRAGQRTKTAALGAGPLTSPCLSL